MTLGQVKRLMMWDNAVNMDARSVISTICFWIDQRVSPQPLNPSSIRECIESSPLVEEPFSDLKLKMILSECSDEPPLYSMNELLRYLSREKFQCELDTRLIPLNQIKDWTIDSNEIYHHKHLYFSVIGVRVETSNREVSSWDQPIIRQQHPGIVGFIVRDINGILHFLVQLKLESGNIDLLGMAPTVQCITGSYENGTLPPYVDEMLKPTQTKLLFDTMQSEEGGRFYHEENRNLLLLGDDKFPLNTPPRYLWISLRQLKQLLMFNNFLNVEARSLLAII
jgi:oxidase EvaA